MKLKIERVYDIPYDLEGYRILVDRLWPRGVSKETLRLDEWDKEIGPSTRLRKWFNHEPEKYSGFRLLYLQELTSNQQTKEFLKKVFEQLKKSDVILLYGAKNRKLNQAVVLSEYIKKTYGGRYYEKG